MEFTLTPITLVAKDNSVTGHRELYLILLLIHCFCWATCRIILVNQRLKHHNFFRIDVSFHVFISCSFVFSFLSLSYMLQLQIYCGESKVLIKMAFFIFCLLWWNAHLLFLLCVSFWVFFFILYSCCNYLPPCNIEGIWFKLKKNNRK